MSEIIIENIKKEHAKGLEILQWACYPTLGEQEIMTEKHFVRHCDLFPEGQFVALSNKKIVGLGSGFLMEFDFDHIKHKFNEIMDYGYYSNHNPRGSYYYGTDISVHPDYRSQGIGSLLYQARKNLCIQLNLKGIVAGGLIPGYVHYKDQMTAKVYAEKVVLGELYDTTLSFQLSKGFKLRGMLEDYLEDSASDNWATLIVWDNPQYRDAESG
ncbi:GNAT family N-acetyltransferase [Anaerolineales bacterium]